MFNAVVWAVSMVLGTLMNSPVYVPIMLEQVSTPFYLAEGPHWDVEDNVLYFIDMFAQNIHCYHPETHEVTYAHLTGGPVTVVVPVAGKKNTFVVGCGTDLIEVLWDHRSNNLSPVTKLISSVEVGRTNIRFNDGKVDPRGRFWAGTMGQVGSGQLIDNIGSLYRFEYNGTSTKVLSPVSISNGLAWSHKKDTFYFADSPTLRVDAYDYNDNTGDISNRRTVFNLVEHNIPGIPDGLTIDIVGHLWVAINGGSRVIEIDPNTGKLFRTIRFPTAKINSVAFGGPNLDVLYVVTAQHDLSEQELIEQPLAGCIFAIRDLGTKGTPMLSYIRV
ncbi:hypothetical protein PV328_003165 [Microctonus aethiopoides]|uniref:Regucalcin n=1 Tax=Microctonus aethiopoides TaxID=144406 RepID=A0AA39F7S8_9HYME|nr:hypothetical protein PV328_003165 [Microctonus aethiopoides]